MPDGMRRLRFRLLQFTALGAGGGLTAWLLLAARSVRPWLVFAVAMTAALLALLVVVIFDRQVMPAVAPPRPGAERPSGSGTSRFTAELEGLERRVAAAMSDPVRFRRILTPLLTDLATQRLRARRQLDLRTDAARQLLGDDLWRMTISSAPLPTGPSRQQLTEWIGRIEAI